MAIQRFPTTFVSFALSMLLFYAAGSNAGPVISEFEYTLGTLSNAELANDWISTGNIDDRVGQTITSSGNPLYFSRSDVPIGNGEAFLFEAVFSAPALTAAGERGARLIVEFIDLDLPQIPPAPYSQLRRVELRLQDDGAGMRWVSLVDGTDGSEKAAVYADWANTNPRNLVRLRRQQIGTSHWIFIEVGPTPESLVTSQVSLSEFGSSPGAASLFLFGNFVGGNYASNWERIRIVRSDSPYTQLPIEQEVLIDVKPGSDPNCFHVNGHGVIPVAILGTSSFDVSSVDQSSLSFGGLDVRVRGNKGPLCALDDTNGDGDFDLVCQFEDNSSYWELGQDDATLTGALLDGTSIEGTDTICIVP